MKFYEMMELLTEDNTLVFNVYMSTGGFMTTVGINEFDRFSSLVRRSNDRYTWDIGIRKPFGAMPITGERIKNHNYILQVGIKNSDFFNDKDLIRKIKGSAAYEIIK